ncbi:hypothetical protein IQ241_00690 [Romeria aff. gracilis LEGE 07310]|uniref:Uncharacterized protein n=1 Tax=Vasconcelosia minhoensis LEGE 07310 TaxID=915328 RepID=A0A8J7DQ34_9CYAN|nr:hypothetical protein [Romeria gracilis]MBE9075829.1 hypothetical protein [Romeria aff. gracilis LEGE 07310]
MPVSEHLLAVLFPFVIWGVLVGFVLSLLFAIEEGYQRLRRLHQIPCYRCRYYTRSPHLKCPVHPTEALSEDAIHCRDYEILARSRSSPNPKPLKKWLLNLIHF